MDWTEKYGLRSNKNDDSLTEKMGFVLEKRTGYTIRPMGKKNPLDTKFGSNHVIVVFSKLKHFIRNLLLT